MSAINNRKDVLLLLLFSPGKDDAFNEPISGRTRLVKMLFLFRQEVLPEFRKHTELAEDEFYEFFAWDFGPFSTEVFDDLNFFIMNGFIETDTSDEETLPESAAEWEVWLQKSGGADEDDVSGLDEETFCLTQSGIDFVTPLYETLSTAQKEMLRTFKKRMQRAPLRGILRYVYRKYDEFTERSKIRDDVLRETLA